MGALESPPDPEALKEFSKRVFGTLQGALTAGLVHLGDRLGLYRALAEHGPASSAELAARCGLDERWVREWLYNQGAAGLLEADPDERFGLRAEGRAVLADEGHPAFGLGLFEQLPEMLRALPEIAECFRTGRGLPYDHWGAEGARGVERGFGPWLRSFLVPGVIAAVPGLSGRLEQGGRVADVGCGAGVALLEIARAYPRSELHGFEISRHALARAEEKRAESGARNVHFHHAAESALPEDGRFDLVLTFDCLHDMTRPAEVSAAIHRALAPDGVWLIAEVKGRSSYAENVAKNPMAAMMYGISVLSCLSSALSEPGGAGLGTLGLPEERARALVQAAGFRRFQRLPVKHPVNAFYEARP